ncbi:MAG: HAMP domain-containing sensor histidine kinase [Patescibacteria group bacterium]
MEFQLLLHNIGGIISTITGLGIAVFCIVNNPHKTVNRVLALVNLCVAIFCATHLIGVNILDPHISKLVFMGNLINVFIVTFTLHTVLVITRKEHSRKGVLWFVYSLSILLALFYIIFPDTFLLDSVHKMYFPNYYVPGALHWVMRIIYNGLVPFYLLCELIDSYRRNQDPIEQNRAKYFFVTMIVGYVVGFIPVFLVYDIPVDPIWGIWFVPLYAIPLVYAIVTYEVVDIKIVARKAFLYGVSIAAVGALIALFNLSNQWIQSAYPGFPIWVTPLISALLAVGVGVFVWNKLREIDVLKYEFITTVTHKFRTPLTHVKWAAENISKATSLQEVTPQISYIEEANAKLVELTNMLAAVADNEKADYSYHLERTDLSVIAGEALDQIGESALEKNIKFERHMEPGAYVSCDVMRIKSVLQILLENAAHYTPQSSVVTVSVQRQGKEVVFSVTDQGIGISKSEHALLFSKFHRGSKAMLMDTEGMGIGLYMAKEIISRHKGRIWVQSEGEGKGSVFSFALASVG